MEKSKSTIYSFKLDKIIKMVSLIFNVAKKNYIEENLEFYYLSKNTRENLEFKRL